jgi:arylsulfatase
MFTNSCGASHRPQPPERLGGDTDQWHPALFENTTPVLPPFGAKYPKQRADKTRIAGTEKLGPGKHTIDFDFKYDGGGLGKGGLGTLAVDGKKVAENRIEQTAPVGKFTLDESFDVGEDTGTPVIDDYDAKMPFKFTGKLEKVVIKLGPDKLTPQQRGELERLKRDFALSVQ